MTTVTPTLGVGDAVLWFGIFAALLLALTVLVRFRENPAANLWLFVFLLSNLGGMLLKFIDHHGMLVDFPYLYTLNKPKARQELMRTTGSTEWNDLLERYIFCYYTFNRGPLIGHGASRST